MIKEKTMATKAYTKKMIIDSLNNLNLKMKYEIDTRPFNLNVFYFTEDGYRSIEIDMKLEMDMEASMEYRKLHHNAIIYNIKGFELSVISLRTSDVNEAEFLLMQHQEAMQVVNLFREISDSNAVLIENN